MLLKPMCIELEEQVVQDILVQLMPYVLPMKKAYVKTIEQYINVQIPIETDHPYPLDPKAKPIVHKKQGSKYKKGRKSEASKKKKKRWY